MNIPQYKKRNLDESKFGDRLTILRLNAGYTQETVAELLYMDSKAYGKYERETAKPSTETIVTLAELYDVSTDYILRGVETSPSEKLSSILARYDVDAQSHILNLLESMITLMNTPEKR